MSTKNTENQEIKDQTTTTDNVDTTATDTASSDNMSENTDTATDTVAEKPVEEQIDWKDQYIRLQAEFDNFRKRTIREKMDLIQSGGSDIVENAHRINRGESLSPSGKDGDFFVFFQAQNGNL